MAARDARKAVDEARDVVAECLGCRPGEVVFTSGGTEADDLAIFGVVRRAGGVAVCAATEHHAVLHPVEYLGGRIVGVDRTGRVDLDQLADALDDSVTVVSVMLANNEVGTIQPLAEVAAVVAERAPGAVLHTDAVQGAVWLDVAREAAPAQLVSVSAHKFGGPKGTGALVVRDGVALEPLLLGGGQERERRSGTHNVAGIVAMAEALRATVAERESVTARVSGLRDRLVDGLVGRRARPRRDRAARPQGAGLGPRLPGGRRERGAAVPARPGRCLRVGGIVVRERRDGSVARARGDGRAEGGGGGGPAAVARVRLDRRRRRPRPRRDPGGRRTAAALRSGPWHRRRSSWP